LPNGDIKFKTGRVVTPKNKVVKLNDQEISFVMNDAKHVGIVDVYDYLRLSLWAHKMTFDHADINKGVISYNNGYEHKSLAAAIMNTSKNKKVCYNNFNRCDCRRNNLRVAENDYLTKRVNKESSYMQVSLWPV